MRHFVRRHRLVCFFGLAYLWAWTDWITLALHGARIIPGSGTPTHLPGLLGPAFAAFLVTALADGWPGITTLGRRLVLVSRPLGRFIAYSLNPISFLALGLLAIMVSSAPLPAAAAFVAYPGLSTMGLLPTFLTALLVNGFGEETGWRGFALRELQGRFGPLGGALVLSVLWGVWHAPLFFINENFRAMPVPMILGGFGLGLAAGSIVLARVARCTSGSILAVALWHTTYNFTSATPAANGLIAAASTTCVMVWATWLVVAELRRRGGPSLLAEARSTPAM